MKRFYSVLLMLALCLSLCGCQSKAAAAVDDQIAAIGTVSLDSGDAIAAAEEAWNALSDEEKGQLKNTAMLEEAKTVYQDLVDEAAARTVQEQIAALGEISLDSAQAIADAQMAYDALSEDVKARVENYDALQQAAGDLKRIQLEESLMGVWYIETSRWDDTADNINNVQSTHLTGTDHDITDLWQEFVTSENHTNLINGRSFCLSEDGFYADEGPMETARLGPWSLNADLTELTVSIEVEGLPVESYIFEIREEDGFTKLYGNYPYENALAFVRKEDLKDAFDAKYFYMTSEEVDVQEYFDDPVDLGYLYDENGTRITVLSEDGITSNVEGAWLFTSKAYEKGLVYITGDFLESTATLNGGSARILWSNPVLVTSNVYANMEFSNANCVLFVRADHVAKNYIDENGSRTLELTDGTVIHSFTEGYYDVINHIWKYLKVDYNDYIY